MIVVEPEWIGRQRERVIHSGALSLVLVLAACSGSGEGALLTFTAPDGPGAASRIELVLASSDEAAMTETKQRIRPGLLSEEPVVYYRQRSSVGEFTRIPSVDGFELRIEPDATIVVDETFVPFALIYDDADALIGVGTVNDESGAPTTVRIKPGMIASYQVAVVALAPDDGAQIRDGQGHAVRCAGATVEAAPWPSGAVWKPASGLQIRLLFPDLIADPAATDARLRQSDLDCDAYPADGRDCDDLRAAYHAGQTETCDGNDTDCDGRRLELMTGCPSPNATCSSEGVLLCADGPNETQPQGQCMPTAACGCQLVAGDRPPSCAYCALSSMAAISSGVTPCAPAVGQIHITGCEPPGCTIDVVGADGPWEIKIGPDEIGPFSTRMTGVTIGWFYLRAKYVGTATFPLNAKTIGAAYVGITTAMGVPAIMPINLELDPPGGQCAAPGTGDNDMRCGP